MPHINNRNLKQLSLKTHVQDYFKYSSVNGLSHIVKKRNHPIEKLFWLAIIVSTVLAIIKISSETINRFLENPTVITIERDHFDWNSSFPGITLCPTAKINQDYLNRFVEYSTVENKTLLREFLIRLAYSNYTNFETIPENNDIIPEEYILLLLDLQFDFNPSVLNTGEHSQSFGLVKIISEMGICYSFNSILAEYNSPDYWQSGDWNILESIGTFQINALDGPIFANIVNMSTGFSVYIHGPYEVADISSKNIDSPNGYFLQLYLTGLTLFSSSRTFNLGVNQRKCRFHYESNLRHSPVYSYVLCRMECRATLSKKLCGCIPHFYRKLDGEKVCNVTGLHCLSKYKERLILLKGECTCLANCDEVNYIVEDMDTREWFLGANLQWGLKEYPKMRLRRDVIFGFSDLLVYIGGMAGLFLGCSVLSFMEIIYFLTIRLYWFVVKYGEDTRRNYSLNWYVLISFSN